MAHSDEPIASTSPSAPSSPSSTATDASTAAALKAINTPRPDSLQSLIAAFTVYDTSFQQRQNDTLIAHAASHCHSLCRLTDQQTGGEAGGWGCLQGCSVQMLQVMSVVQERFMEQQQRVAETAQTEEEEEEEEGEEDEEEVEVVVVVGEHGEEGDEQEVEAEISDDVAAEADGTNATTPSDDSAATTSPTSPLREEFNTNT